MAIAEWCSDRSILIPARGFQNRFTSTHACGAINREKNVRAEGSTKGEPDEDERQKVREQN